MVKQTISDNEHLQLIGLLTLAAIHNAKLKEIIRAVQQLTGDEREDGHASDAVYCDYDADELLKKLAITVAAA